LDYLEDDHTGVSQGIPIMTIRPKTKRRLLILLVGAALFSVVIAWLYSYRIAIAERKLLDDKQAGLEAYRNGDYPTAIDKLREYINHEQKRDPQEMDPQALLAFATSSAKVPGKNQDYIVTAVTTLRRYCVMMPDDVHAREQLVEMEAPYATYTPDALSRANDLLKSNPDDLPALKAVAEINFRQQKFEDAAPAVKRYVELAPTDLELQKIYFQVMQSMSHPTAELQQHADDLLTKYPADPRFRIVKAMALYYGRNNLATPEENRDEFKQYRSLILDAAKADPPTAQFAKTTIALLDGMAEFGAADDLLERSSAKFNDPQLIQETILRLWETRKYSEVVTRLKDLDASADGTSDYLIAYKAMSLHELGKPADSGALIDQLAARGSDDHVAYAWATALKALYSDPPEDLKTRMAQYQDVLTQDSQTPAPEVGYVDSLLGDAYAQLGESELATTEFQQACQSLPSWAEPHVRLAQLLLAEGRGASDEAAVAAEDARLAGTNAAGTVDIDAATVNIEVTYARLQALPGSTNAADLLTEVKQLQSQVPNEPSTLPIYLALLAQQGERDTAIDEIDQVCKNPGNGGEDLLLTLAQTSRTAKLGMEPTIYSAIEAKYGVTPRLAFTRAIDLLNSGRTEDGLAYLTALQAKDKNPANASYWDRAICKYREDSHNPTAAVEWQKLGDKYPTDVMVQSTILTSANSAWTNQDFISRTIDRLKALTGDSAIGWKTAQARWLLAGNMDDKSATAAVALLTAVINQSPNEYLPHVLLATAYDRLKDQSPSLDEWRKASELAPQSPQAQFAYLQALHKAGKTQDVQVVFDRLAGMNDVPPDMALAAATILAAEGDMQRAENMLVAFPNTTNRVLHDATLAKVYRVENRPNDAAALYVTLASAKTLDVNTIREAADFFGAQNQMAEAQKFLDRLSELQLPPGESQTLQAAFQEEHGNLDAAAKLYDEAVKAGGNNADASIQRIGFLIRRRDWNDAHSAIAAAIAQWPDNVSAANLSRVANELSTYPRLDELGTLIDAVTNDPQSQPAMDTIAAATDPGSTLQQFRALVQKYPDFEPAYELCSRRLMAAGDTGDAVATARTAMGRFARSVDAARTTAEVNAAAGNWNDAMIAGREWRQRVTENPVAADQFIAIADLAVDQPLDAVDRLAPYIAGAKSQPDDSQMLLSTYCEALIRTGRESDAAAILQPLAQNSSKWRLAWLDLAPVSFTTGTDSDGWIAQIKPLLSADSIDEQGDLAEVYVACAERQDYPQDYAAAIEVLKPFLSTPKMGAPQWLTYAGAATGQHDMPTAQQAYRQVLKLDASNPVAENNLADLLRQTGTTDSLKEAEGLIAGAISQHGGDAQAFDYYDTYARILLKENRPTEAISAFEKGNTLNPKSLDILIGLASTCANNNQMDEAVRYLSQIDTLEPAGAHLSSELQSELENARQLVRKNDTHSSVSGTDYSPSGK
jgi:tetratricopeptide (TPR) repeat protein